MLQLEPDVYRDLVRNALAEDRGRGDATSAATITAGQVFGAPGGHANFRYVRELVDGHEACLEFVAEVDGITVNGIDLIAFDANWKIRDFKVMVRPLKAINKLWELMAAQLKAQG